MTNPPGKKFCEDYAKRISEGLQYLPPLFNSKGQPFATTERLFKVGERVVIKNSTWQVAYLNDRTLVLEPVSLPIVGEEEK